jgi:hypothetical protein
MLLNGKVAMMNLADNIACKQLVKDFFRDRLTTEPRGELAVREDHPNPERVGCPGRPALTMLAEDSAALRSDSVLEHIRKCAACLDELNELRLTIRRPQ